MSFIALNPAAPSRPLLALRRLTPYTLPLLILLLAALLHSLHLTSADISSDEAHSYIMATSHTSILTNLQSDTNPPLYFLLLKPWLLLFGTSLAALRSLSLLFSLLLTASLYPLAQLCHASKKTTLLAMLLLSLNPLQLYYAQDARNYTLALLLLTLSLITFLQALKSNSKKAWLLHALLLTASAYTHFLLIPLTLAYHLAAPFLKMSRTQYRNLLLSHAFAALLSIPLLILLLHQLHSSHGTDCITPYWQSISHPLAIPTSLELLAFGSTSPSYLPLSPFPQPLRLLALTLLLLSAAAFLYPKPTRAKQSSGVSPRNSAESPLFLTNQQHELKNTRWLLLTFTLFPLLFLYLYSTFLTPLYLHARYDLFAQPPLLLLLAAGLTRLQNSLTSCAMPTGAEAPLGIFKHAKSFLKLLLPIALTIIFAASFASRLTFPSDAPNTRHRSRALYLAAHLHPTDLLLCTGLEYAPTRYSLHQLHLSPPIQTFPAETLSHFGWFLPDNQILSTPNWPTLAQNLLRTAASAGHKKIWLILDRNCWDPTPQDFAPFPRQQLTQLLLTTACSLGYHRADPTPTGQQQENSLRILSLQQNP